MMESMGERVRRIRKTRGFTAAELASRSGLSRSTIVKIEAGKRSRTCERYVKLAKALDCRIDDLFPEMDDIKTASAGGFENESLDDFEM